MNSSTLYFLVFICFGFAMSSCVVAPEFPDEPVITFQGVSRTMMDQGALNQDSIVVFFSFTDGDGDLGIPSDERQSDNFDLFVIDKRTDNVQDKFHLPYVPPKGASNGISGNGRIVLFSTCCIYEDDMPPPCSPSDTPQPIEYEIYVVDRSGKESNRIETGILTLNCI